MKKLYALMFTMCVVVSSYANESIKIIGRSEVSDLDSCPLVDKKSETLSAQANALYQITKICSSEGLRPAQIDRFVSVVSPCLLIGGGTFHVHSSVITYSEASFICVQ